MVATMEKKKAQKKAAPVPVKEESAPGTMEWSWEGVLSRHRTAKSGDVHITYLRGAAFREFLRQAPKNDDPFTYKDFQYNEDMGSGDFYTVKDFGEDVGCIQRAPGSAYRIVDHAGLMRAWSNGMESLKIS